MDIIERLQTGAVLRPVSPLDPSNWVAVVGDKSVAMFSHQEVKPLIDSGRLVRTGDNYALAENQPATKIFVVSTPKSGSSFVVTFLQTITGFGHHNPILEGQPQLEADPDLRSVETQPNSAVSQLHCYAKPKTLDLCARFSIRPIFITRNIFDSLRSMKEYMDAVDHRSVFPNYYRLETEEQKRSFLIDVYAPIIVRMVVGWREADAPVLWYTYESFFKEPELHARHMLEHIGLSYSDEQITSALDATRRETQATKLNKGTSGRGRLWFSHDEQNRITRLLESFPGFDAVEAGIL